MGLCGGLLPLVFNVISNSIFDGSIFAVHPVQFAPVVTCWPVLCYTAEKDSAEAWMRNSNYKLCVFSKLPDERPSFTSTTNKKNQTVTDISIRGNEKSVSNHWPEPGTDLQWSPGWLPSSDGCLVGQKMAAKRPVPARGRGCTSADEQQRATLRSLTTRSRTTDTKWRQIRKYINWKMSSIVSLTRLFDQEIIVVLEL